MMNNLADKIEKELLLSVSKKHAWIFKYFLIYIYIYVIFSIGFSYGNFI